LAELGLAELGLAELQTPLDHFPIAKSLLFGPLFNWKEKQESSETRLRHKPTGSQALSGLLPPAVSHDNWEFSITCPKFVKN